VTGYNVKKPERGRYPMHSLAGLLNADFHQPSIDYADIIKAGQVLCRSIAVGKELFTRAMFNLFALNQDDHAKNWSFLMDDQGKWRLSPFYDVTFSPNPHNQHMTAFAGHGNSPPLKTIQHLAVQANFKNWQEAQQVMVKITDALSCWPGIAASIGVDKTTAKMISQQLNMVYKQNKVLLQ